MGCSDSDDNKVFPPASTLTVEGALPTTDPRILQAVNDASAALKQAGVSTVKIKDWGSFPAGSDAKVDVLPIGGNPAEVNASLDAIKTELRDAGLGARVGPAFRCAGSPMEVQARIPAKSDGPAR